jgi:putative ABC transport system permease protein
MSPVERWSEILEVLRRRKLRTVLTALSVAWGIFMLVVLLAAGNGLANGVQAAFQRDAVNSVWLMPGLMGKPWQGNPIGRRIQLYDDDLAYVQKTVPQLMAVDARFGPGERVISRGPRQRRSEIRGCLPGRAEVHPMPFSRGRFINDQDVAEHRRVTVLEQKAVDALFVAGEDPIGSFINVGGAPLQVVGVFEEAEDESEQGLVYLPLTTAQLVFGGGNRLHQISFTVASNLEETIAATNELLRGLSGRKGFAPDDRRALRVGNQQEMFARLTGLFAGIRAFVWLIGLGTILAGVVGVGNIMLISVAERTREIGLRKAIGAPPSVIVRMIVEESLVLTVTSGYLGLCVAVAVVTGAAKVLPKTDYFSHPEVNLGVGLAATGVLVIAGILAGLFPAVRAARVNPITALRVE